MMLRIVILWFIGMLTIVPYAVYQLLFYATKDQYAFLIVIPFFWIFGFWGVVAPLIAAWKILRITNALEKAGSDAARMAIFESQETEELIIGAIAAENRIPKFLARIIYKKISEKLRDSAAEKSETK